MPIKRRITIDEFDNDVDSHSDKGLPTKGYTVTEDAGTSISAPELEQEVATDLQPSDSAANIKQTVGRTVSDLVIESKNDYRIMAVVLTGISILIFVPKIDITKPVFDYYKYPLITAFTLNFIWFGIPWIVTFFKRSKQKKSSD